MIHHFVVHGLNIVWIFHCFTCRILPVATSFFKSDYWKIEAYLGVKPSKRTNFGGPTLWSVLADGSELNHIIGLSWFIKEFFSFFDNTKIQNNYHVCKYTYVYFSIKMKFFLSGKLDANLNVICIELLLLSIFIITLYSIYFIYGTFSILMCIFFQ